MSIALKCLCGRAFNIKDDLAGRKIRCPACKLILLVPAAEKEIDPDDLVLDVLRADDPDDVPSERESRRAAIQSEPPEALPVRRRSREDDEEVSSIRRRQDDDRPVKRRPKLRREDARRGPRVAFEPGWFGSVNAGVVGGLLMILIAVVWFVAGLAVGYIFFYPIFLVVAGIAAIGKGLVGRD